MQNIQQLKDQVLKTIFREIGHETTKSASIYSIRNLFDHIDKDTFFDTVEELIKEQLLFDRGRGSVAFTPLGWDKANAFINPSQEVVQNTYNIGSAHNSQILQGNNSQQTVIDSKVSNDDLNNFLHLMKSHINDLELSPENFKKVNAQLSTIEAQLTDEPNHTIIKEAVNSIKNIVEGVISSLIANVVQPKVWPVIQSFLAQF